MNDFDYDVMQKKRIARGAAHMRRGSKSKKCSLPSDAMTQAEWKRRNGPVSTIKMDAPMTWKEFKALPLDIQQLYIDRIQEKFSVSVTAISTDLFKLSQTGLKAHLNNKGLKYRGMQGYSLNPKAAAQWHDWICGETKTEEPVMPDPVEEPTPEKPKEEPVNTSGSSLLHALYPNLYPNLMTQSGVPIKYAPEPKKPEPEPLGLGHLSATFAGTFDPEKFMQWIAKLPMPEGEVRITVEVCKK